MALDIEAISIAWELQTGYDSIPTIRRVYGRTESGSYECVYPHCKFTRKDAEAMWRHVHTKHGSYSLPPDVVRMGVPVESVAGETNA